MRGGQNDVWRNHRAGADAAARRDDGDDGSRNIAARRGAAACYRER